LDASYSITGADKKELRLAEENVIAQQVLAGNQLYCKLMHSSRTQGAMWKVQTNSSSVTWKIKLAVRKTSHTESVGIKGAVAGAGQAVGGHERRQGACPHLCA